MMRSLSSAVSGLRSHQTRMDVIGNNIANVNTYGFKSSRVTFSDVYYQTTSAGSRGNDTLGGTNPTQIGYGSKVATIDVLNNASGAVSTDRGMDIYINGDGMIATKDSNGNLQYSRLGILGFDANGYLVDVSGNFVMGFPMNDDGTPKVNPDGSCGVDDLSKIKIPTEYIDDITDVYIESNGNIIGILPGETTGKLTSGLPSWLQDVIIPEGSNLAGAINLTMEYQYQTDSALPLDWISKVEVLNDSRCGGTWTFGYDADGTVTAINSSTGEMLTGEYIRAGEVKLYKNGEHVMTVTTDAYAEPSTTATGNMTFTEQKYIVFTGTDVGGNKLRYEQVYNDTDLVTLGEGTTQIQVRINPSAVEDKDVFKFEMSTTAGAKPAWLRAVNMGSSSSYTGDVYLEYGTDYVAKAITSGPDYAAYNWIDETWLEGIMAHYSSVTGSDTNFKVVIECTDENATPIEYTVQITDGTNVLLESLGVTTATDPIVFTDETTGSVFSTLSGTDPLEMTVKNAFSSNLSDDGAFVDYAIGSATGSPVLRLREIDQNGKILDQVVYTGNSKTVSLAGMSFIVDPDALKADLALGIKGSTVGKITQGTEKDWLLSRQVSTAEISEGETFTIGCIALASIPNMVAMIQQGDSYFKTSGNSGEASFWKPGTSNVGTCDTGMLEMSNVDISKEFTDMITTQRGFQANTRIITVSDEMLQELVNLKR